MDTIMELDRIVKLAKIIFNEDNLGVTYNELLILSSIKNEYNTLKEISDYQLINKSHVHRTLGKLVEMGLLKKIGSKHYLTFVLTIRGEKVIENAMNVLKFVSEEDLKGIKKGGESLKEMLKDQSERLAKIYY